MIEPRDGHAYLAIVIRTLVILRCLAADLPDRLARGAAVLVLLVLAAAAMGAAPASARIAVADGPACAVAAPRVAILSGAPDAAPEAKRPVFGRMDLCPADLEILTELGLPRPPIEAPRPRHTFSASFGYTADPVPPSAPDGSPHRPPRIA